MMVTQINTLLSAFTVAVFAYLTNSVILAEPAIVPVVDVAAGKPTTVNSPISSGFSTVKTSPTTKPPVGTTTSTSGHSVSTVRQATGNAGVATSNQSSTKPTTKTTIGVTPLARGAVVSGSTVSKNAPVAGRNTTSGNELPVPKVSSTSGQTALGILAQNTSVDDDFQVVVNSSQQSNNELRRLKPANASRDLRNGSPDDDDDLLQPATDGDLSIDGDLTTSDGLMTSGDLMTGGDLTVSSDLTTSGDLSTAGGLSTDVTPLPEEITIPTEIDLEASTTELETPDVTPFPPPLPIEPDVDNSTGSPSRPRDKNFKPFVNPELYKSMDWFFPYPAQFPPKSSRKLLILRTANLTHVSRKFITLKKKKQRQG